MNDQEHKCKCDFRIRMLGDGCRYCQPQEYIDRLHDTMDGMIHADCFELTDEEIMDYVEAFSIDMGNVYEFQPDNVLQMIRAILDKAQEK